MPTTRKKVIKSVYKDENDSEPEETGDFSDSGSEAQISDHSSSEDDNAVTSGEEFVEDEPKISKAKAKKPVARRKVQYAKTFINKIRNESLEADENVPAAPAFTVKDLTDADKLLPSFLNLSESDSSEDESPRKPNLASGNTTIASITSANNPDSEDDSKMEYQDVWSKNVPDNSEEIAQKTFKELEMHKAKMEETKAAVLNYSAKTSNQSAFDVKDLLAQGEEVLPDPVLNKKKPKLSKKKKVNDSDSEMEDWEEVKESKALPASGLQVVVDFPDAVARKSKKLDLAMMMKRKMNRVKKEYQVYMHKVHVLCWLGHGNYVSSVINNQEIMSAVLTLVPSKECYPGERVDIKYVEQIVKWFTNKLTLKQDKNENKFKPKAPPLKEIMLKEIKSKVVSTKKFMVFIFVSMLRALGLQCRVMFNFVTLPIKPPSSELCSLSTKVKDEKADLKVKKEESKKSNLSKKGCAKKTLKESISQLDGNDDGDFLMLVDESGHSDSHIMQVDGNDDDVTAQKNRKSRLTRSRKAVENIDQENEDVSPPKRARKLLESSKGTKAETKKKTQNSTAKCSDSQTAAETVKTDTNKVASPLPSKTLSLKARRKPVESVGDHPNASQTKPKPRQTKSSNKKDTSQSKEKLKTKKAPTQNVVNTPDIMVTDENNKPVSSTFFSNNVKEEQKPPNRTRSQTSNPKSTKTSAASKDTAKSRSKSASAVEKSKYFSNSEKPIGDSKPTKKPTKVKVDPDDQLRVSHRDLKAKIKTTSKGDVTADLIDIIESRMSETKHITPNRKPVKGKKNVNKDDSDYQPEDALSDEDFKPSKISPKPSSSRKIDRRVISTDDEAPKDKSDVWCEIYVEELEQWIAVDLVKGKVHCTSEIYSRATHPVCYVVGWDNNNYLKDLTRRYVPHWNTVTRKQRVEPLWWDQAIAPFRGLRTAKDKEEDDSLDRMQLDAPLPKSIAEYKNHPLYALKRHLLKYEALYPPDAATLGFVRNEPVYARECVYICRSRDTWLKEAKVVKLGEKPYKIVKARPKWDKLSNKCITDKPLEIFGPWQVQDYEPPVAENGIVPRNAYGNVELFKECMLPKGTAHVKLPGLNRVAKKLNIDCAPAMTGFDFNGGWSHPVYDGFVVCKEFEEIITDAWLKDQEDQERREREKTEARVYGLWKRLIRGLMIRERLKLKYGFEEPSAPETKKSKGPRLVVKKK